jgi:hypothetical protein
MTAVGKPSTLVREIVARHGARVFRKAILRSPVRTVELEELMDDGLSHRRTKAILDPSGPVELCCHPGTGAIDGKSSSHRRAAELDYLLSPRFRALVSQINARLVTYWEV